MIILFLIETKADFIETISKRNIIHIMLLLKSLTTVSTTFNGKYYTKGKVKYFKYDLQKNCRI